MLSNGQQRFLGYWSVGENFYRAGGTRLGQLASAGVSGAGTRPVSFDYFAPGRDHNSIHAEETWRVAGSGAVTVPAGTYDAVRVERRFQVVGSTFAYTQTLWFDRTSGAPVKAKIEHLNPIQAPTLVNWEATEIRSPSRQATR